MHVLYVIDRRKEGVFHAGNEVRREGSTCNKIVGMECVDGGLGREMREGTPSPGGDIENLGQGEVVVC